MKSGKLSLAKNRPGANPSRTEETRENRQLIHLDYLSKAAEKGSRLTKKLFPTAK